MGVECGGLSSLAEGGCTLQPPSSVAVTPLLLVSTPLCTCVLGIGRQAGDCCGPSLVSSTVSEPCLWAALTPGLL